MSIQTPGKRPIRPIRALNSGNGNGERIPSGNEQNKNSGGPQSNSPSVSKSMAKSAMKFAFTPEIGRSLEGVKLAWNLLVNLVAQIYVMVKLIPEDHPCTNLRHASEYKLIDIIKIAFKSLKWKRDQIPQIIIFFAVLAFLFFIALSLITLVLNVSVNAAHAQTTASTGNSANDVLNSIFNLQGSGMIPNAFGAMLKAYSNIILVLAGIILLYHILHYVLESARHGQPGGKSFNHGWAPIRLVFALGLLIPLSSGLNSGQYITLYLAKWGSDMASNVYKQFAISLQSGQGVTVSQVTVQPKKALENLFNLEACLAHYNVQNPGSMISSPNMQDDSAQPNGKVLDFSGTTLGTATGCGKIHFYYNATATNPNEVLLNQQYTFFVAYLPQIQTLAQDFISHSDPQSANYFQAIQTSTYSDQISSLATSYSQQINTAAQTAIADTNTKLGQEMQNSINSIGWVTAPTWLQRIANQNSAVADAQFSLPNVTNNSEDYAGQATGKTSSPPSAVSTPEEIESWKSQTAAKAQDIGQNAIVKIFGSIPQFGPLIYKSVIMSSSNPFCSLVAFGKTLFRGAEAAYSGWLSVVTALGLSATSIMGNQINVGEALLQSITPMVTAFIGITFMTGMMLGFMLPLIPTIRFIFAVLGWIILVFVAVMGMPLFALAHLKTGGEGWIGQLQVASSYNLLMGIIVRPTLIILGFIASLIVFNTIMKMAGTLLYMSASSDNAVSLSSAGVNSYMNGIDALDPLAQIIKIFIFSSFVQAVANACFKLVDVVPSQAMAWMGTGPISSPVEGGGDEATQLSQGLGQQMSSAFHGRLQIKPRKYYEICNNYGKHQIGLRLLRVAVGVRMISLVYQVLASQALSRLQLLRRRVLQPKFQILTLERHKKLRKMQMPVKINLILQVLLPRRQKWPMLVEL